MVQIGGLTQGILFGVLQGQNSVYTRGYRWFLQAQIFFSIQATTRRAMKSIERSTNQSSNEIHSSCSWCCRFQPVSFRSTRWVVHTWAVFGAWPRPMSEGVRVVRGLQNVSRPCIQISGVNRQRTRLRSNRSTSRTRALRVRMWNYNQAR